VNQVLEFLTLSHLALFMAFICSVWAIRTLFTREGKSLFTPLFFVLIFVAGSIVLDMHNISQYNLLNLKQKLFPEKPLLLNYEIQEWKSDFTRYRSYTFSHPRPKITLKPTDGGKYFILEDIDQLNAILRALKLPEVTHGTPELATITGSTLDVTKFQWKDYPLGTLTVIRDLCRDRQALTSYHCLSRIIIAY